MAENTTPYYLQEKLTRKQLLEDEEFLEDASKYLYDRTGSAYDDPAKIVDELAEVMRWGTTNEVSMARTYRYAKNANEEQRDTMGKMFLAFDKGEKITSNWEWINDYVGGILTAPSTVAAIGTGGLGLLSKGAVRGGMTRVASLINDLTVKNVLSKTTRGEAFRRGAIAGAAVEAPIGAVHGAGEAASRKLTGREEFKDIDVVEQALIGGATGALFGGAVSGGVRVLRRSQELKAQELFGKGLAATETRAKEARKEFDVYFKLVGEVDKAGQTKLVKIREGVRGQLDPLKDSMIGRELKAEIVPTPEGFKASFSDNVHENIIDAASEILHKYGTRAVDFTEDKRITERIIDAINFAGEGKVDRSQAFKAIDKILEKYALTREQFTSIFRADMSEWGKVGQKLGKLSKDNFEYRLTKATEDLTATRFLSPAAQKRFEEISRLAESGEVAIWKGIQAIDKFRLGMMTIQTATTIRNTANAGVRTALYALDNFFYGAFTLNPSRMQSGLTAGRQILNPSESNYLRLMFAQNMPDEFQTLFRQMADIEAGALESSKLVGIARFLNRANTLADNSFKRAIFMSELKSILAKKAKTRLHPKREGKTLRQHMEEGTFGTIDRNDIAKAMEEALHFTYQKSFPARGPKGKRYKKGLWNAIGNGFIEAFSNPATSTIIPFPRFVANSLEFMYKHAPIIGMADPGLFYRAAKGASTLEIRKRFSQQLTGTTMLYGAIQLRAQQGPTANWWEVYDEETGKYKNALAFYGPFAPWMLLADKIVRTMTAQKDLIPGVVPIIIGEETRATWDKVEHQSLPKGLYTLETGRDFMKAAFGSTFRTGMTREFFKELADLGRESDNLFAAKGDISRDVLGEKYRDEQIRLDDWAAKWVGNYLNTFLVPLGQLRDVMIAYDPKEYAGVKETDVVNPVEDAIRRTLRSAPITRGGEYDIPFAGLFSSKDAAEGVFKWLGGKGTPAEDVVTATALPGTRQEREDTVERQLTGLGSPAYKNVLEEEMQKHQLLSYKLFPKIKDAPELTRRLRIEYRNLVEKNLIPYIRGEHKQKYAELSPESQRRNLQLQIEYVRENSLDVVERSILAELEQNNFVSDEERNRVNDQLTRIMQIRFRKADEGKQVLAVEKFNRIHKRKPNLDIQQDLKALLSDFKIIKLN